MTSVLGPFFGGEAGVAWLAGGVVTILKATALLLVAMAAARLLRARSASLRHLVWTGALVAVLALPALDSVLPSGARVAALAVPAAWAGGAPPNAHDRPESAPGTSAQATGARAAAGARPSRAADGGAGSGGHGPAGWASRLGWTLFALWTTGGLVVLGRTAWGTWHLARVRRRAEPLDERSWRRPTRPASGLGGEGAPARILVSPEVSVPLTCGLLRSTLLLPQEALDAWPRERTEAVLVHELAHLRRRDTATQLLARLACAVYWFHPLVWRAAGEAARERERACDDAVLRAGVKASAYARHLLEIARRGGAGPATEGAAVSIARPSDLERRVLAVLEQEADRRPLSGALSAAALLPAAVLTLGSAAVSVQAGSAHSDAAPPRTGVAEVETERGTVDPAAEEDPGAAARAVGPRRTDGAVGRWRSEGAVAVVTDALDDPDPEVRRAAADALAEVEDPSAVGALRRVLVSDSSVRVQKAAAWALGETESPEAVEALEAAIRHVEHRWVRKRIARALGETRQPSAVPALRELLRGGDGKVRAAALDGLVENGSERAKTALAAALESDDPKVRGMAARALGRDG